MQPLPSLQRVFVIGRAGALDAAPKVAQIIGGGAAARGLVNASDGSINLFGLQITAEGRAILNMAIAMSLHYLGYSLARPSSLSLFTSSTTGFSKSSAFPLAMAFVSPMSLLLLMGYGKELDAYGPRTALRNTTLYCAMVLTISAALIQNFTLSGISYRQVPLVKVIVGILFVFRESYVQLLTSQMWSFMVSVSTPAQSATWFAPISGLTSITSALAGFWVSTLTAKIGLTGVMAGAGLSLIASILFSDQAYSLSDKFGFNPANEIEEKHSKKEKESSSHEESLISKASKVFTRVPTLKALFFEILACQGLSTLLNVCFVSALKAELPNDDERAGWMGKFFAIINLISSGLQFGVLPSLMSRIEPSWLWRAMPLIMIVLTTYQSLQVSPALKIVAMSFMAMKTLEFSVRRMLDEMVYVPLDFESRYVGKEVIGVFGYRFGKSGMSLILSGLTSIFGNFGLEELSKFTTAGSFLWLLAAFKLSHLIPSRKEAEEKYQKTKKKN